MILPRTANLPHVFASIRRARTFAGVFPQDAIPMRTLEMGLKRRHGGVLRSVRHMTSAELRTMFRRSASRLRSRL